MCFSMCRRSQNQKDPDLRDSNLEPAAVPPAADQGGGVPDA